MMALIRRVGAAPFPCSGCSGPGLGCAGCKNRAASCAPTYFVDRPLAGLGDLNTSGFGTLALVSVGGLVLYKLLSGKGR